VELLGFGEALHGGEDILILPTGSSSAWWRDMATAPLPSRAASPGRGR
jgi:hypothetical protein